MHCLARVSPACRLSLLDSRPPYLPAYLNGLIPLPGQDCNLLALVLNERLVELNLPQLAAYIR